jgi:hypothetical protein
LIIQDRSDRPWTYTQVLQIGEFFYDIMLKHMKLRVPLLTKQRQTDNKKSEQRKRFPKNEFLFLEIPIQFFIQSIELPGISLKNKSKYYLS